jgi:hypothetical protein
MKYAVEIGSGAMIYIPSFITTNSGIQNLMGEGDTHTEIHRQQDDRISLLLLFLSKESRLTKMNMSFSSEGCKQKEVRTIIESKFNMSNILSSVALQPCVES